MSKSKIFLNICLIFILAVFVDSYITGIYIPGLSESPADTDAYSGQEIALRGLVTSEPDVRLDKVNLVVRNKQLGQVLVSTELATSFKYGDFVEIRGKVLEPKIFDDFNYKEYLAKDKIYYVMYQPQIKLLASNQGNYFYAQILGVKNRLRQGIDATLLPPQSSILKAIFLGDKQSLSDDLKEDLNLTGTRHMVAISGMHLVIASQILMYLALGIGMWRPKAFYFVVISLFLYVVMIGLPASALRAYIFTFLLLLAQKVGRLNSAGRAVVIAAALMLVINPLLLKSDVGFQLSFVAVLGIIYLKPIIDKWFKRLPNPYKLKDILTLTLAAQIAVLGLLIYHFGRVSLISPVVNVIIVPFLPILMMSALVLSLTSLIWLGLAKIIAWPIGLLVSFVVKIIEYLSNVPFAAFGINNFSWVYLFFYYLALVAFIRKYRVEK